MMMPPPVIGAGAAVAPPGAGHWGMPPPMMGMGGMMPAVAVPPGAPLVKAGKAKAAKAAAEQARISPYAPVTPAQLEQKEITRAPECLLPLCACMPSARVGHALLTPTHAVRARHPPLDKSYARPARPSLLAAGFLPLAT